jgi:gliding motility-associated-like protein
MGSNFITRQIIAPAQTADRWYRMRTTSLGCFAETSPVKVTLKPKPVVTTRSNDSNTPGAGPLTKISLSVGNSTQVFAEGAATYLWTPPISISNIRSASPFLSPLINTNYKVYGTSEFGCIDSARVEITVTKEFLVYPNNILTPNGDGYNDTWKVRNIEFYPDNVVTIYNSNSVIVRELQNYTGDWNGTSSGGLKLGTGTYFYIIKIKDNDKEAIIKGFLTLLN